MRYKPQTRGLTIFISLLLILLLSGAGYGIYRAVTYELHSGTETQGNNDDDDTEEELKLSDCIDYAASAFKTSSAYGFVGTEGTSTKTITINQTACTANMDTEKQEVTVTLSGTVADSFLSLVTYIGNANTWTSAAPFVTTRTNFKTDNWTVINSVKSVSVSYATSPSYAEGGVYLRFPPTVTDTTPRYGYYIYFYSSQMPASFSPYQIAHQATVTTDFTVTKTFPLNLILGETL